MRTNRRLGGTTMLAALVALLALPGAARANPAPLAANGIPVDPNRSVSGHFDVAGTQTWRVYLRQGRSYALRGATGAYEDVAVRSPGGGVAARFSMAVGNENGDGVSFRAGTTGLHTVTVTLPASCFYGTPCLGGDRTGDYSLSVGRDCPGDASTPCAIVAGQNLSGLWISFGGDADWFRASLTAGRTYELSVPSWSSPGAAFYAGFVDAQGRALSAETTAAGDSVRFTPRSSGPYFVAAGADEGPGRYALTLVAVP